MDDAPLSIGDVAARAGIAVSAIRYYERVGLLPPAERVSGQRRYGDETLRRLEIIDVTKRAGFSLDEIRTLLDVTDAGAPAHEQLQALARQKLPAVRELIERARMVERWLSVATACGCDTLDVCKLFEPEVLEAPPEPLRAMLVAATAGS